MKDRETQQKLREHLSNDPSLQNKNFSSKVEGKGEQMDLKVSFPTSTSSSIETVTAKLRDSLLAFKGDVSRERLHYDIPSSPGKCPKLWRSGKKAVRVQTRDKRRYELIVIFDVPFDVQKDGKKKLDEYLQRVQPSIDCCACDVKVVGLDRKSYCEPYIVVACPCCNLGKLDTACCHLLNSIAEYQRD